jgi:hypothetical protein
MRVNVDDQALTDERFALVGERVGRHRRHVLGDLVHLWNRAQQARSSILAGRTIDVIAEFPGYAAALAAEGLAEDVGGGMFRLRGVDERLSWLLIQDAKRAKALEAKRAKAGLTSRDVPGDAPRRAPEDSSRDTPEDSTSPEDVPGDVPSALLCSAPDLLASSRARGVRTAEQGAGPPRRASRRRPATACPERWVPNAQAQAQAQEAGLDLDREAESFRDHHTAKGSVFADWDAAFRNWLRHATRFASERAAPVRAATRELGPARRIKDL